MILTSDFKGWKKLEYIWFAVSLITTVSASIYLKAGAMSIIAMIINIICVILLAKGKVSNFIFSIVGSILYGYITYSNAIYGDAIMRFVYNIPMGIYGYMVWKNNKVKADDDVEFRMLTTKERIFGGLGVIVAIAALASFLQLINGNNVILDATTTILGITALFLMSKRYTENWYLWILVNAISVILWLKVGNISPETVATLLMWVVFLLNSIFGTINWKRQCKLSEVTV
jgi:nicotinamide mononucleotide transporter